MSYFWFPALTFGGALLFFAAGRLTALASRLSPARPALPVHGEFTRLDPGGGASDLQTETRDRHDARQDGWQGAGPDHRPDGTGGRRVELDEDDARELFERVLSAEDDARSARLELEQQVSRSEELQHDLDELGEQLLRVQRQPLTRGAPRSGPAAQPGEIEAALGRERQRTVTLERELIDLRTQLVQTSDADAIAGLRRDLMVAKEQVRTRQGMADRAAAENARQKAQLGELGSLRAELNQLRSENADLRARGMVVQKPRKLASPQTARPGEAGTRPSGESFQAMVDELGARDEVRAAVVADELGLVVAASGENSDAMAAVGAVVARAAAQVGRLLPLGLLRQVALRDEHDLTVTLRPLDTTGRKLLLLTLALGEIRDAGSDGSGDPATPLPTAP